MKKENENENDTESSENEEEEEEIEKRDTFDSAPKSKQKMPKFSIGGMNPRMMLFAGKLRTSIAGGLMKPEQRKFKNSPNISITRERVAQKKTTRIDTGMGLVTQKIQERINYPLEDLRPFPIIESVHKELIYIYITEDEMEYYLLHSVNKKNKYAIYEEDIIYPLKYHLPIYYQKMFKYRGNLEERLDKSTSEKMRDIKPIYSIAIEMDEKLKSSDIFKNQVVNLLDKRDIFKNRENEEENGKVSIPKWAVSIKAKYDIQSDDESSEDEYSRRQSQDFFDIVNTQNNIIKSNSDNNSNNEIKKKEKKEIKPKEEIIFEDERENENEEEEDKEEQEENEELEEENMEEEEEENKNLDPYKEFIKGLFYPKFDDFRKEIIGVILEQKIFEKMNFEKYICLLEFFITLFTGIQVKYTIDEQGFLNMDLYADELIYMNMAEIFHYQVQFQIRDISHSIEEENSINPDIIIDLNKFQYEDFLFDKIEFFPPSTAFIQELCNHYRRYTNDDKYHLCQECEQLFSIYKYKKTECDSSVFRFIDKARLLTMTLFSIMDINILETMIEKNKDEETEKEPNNVFLATMIHNNEDVFNEFNIFYVIKAYLCPTIINPTKKLNHVFRNIFGEIIGYYYTWASHYISWLIFPAILGLITEIIIFFVNVNYIQNIIYLLFLGSFLLWGFYYVRDWKKKEKFCNHIWGMDSFQAEVTNLYDENYSKVPYVTFLGIKIPKVDKLSALMVNIISIILVLTSSLFIMGVNVGIFKVNKVDFFINKFFNKIFSYFGISVEISKYTLPILIYIAREIISRIFYKISAVLAKLERPTDKEEYDEIVIKKRLTLEFVNYYFNLYYIMIYKRMYNKCENEDCFQELRKQLIVILISNICSLMSKFAYRFINLKNSLKNVNITKKQVEGFNSDYTQKLKFYTRELFTEDDIQQLILPIIFNFGYAIQFGICCPISFFFMLILIIFLRLTNAISMIYVYYVKILGTSKGFLVYNNTQQLFVFVGLFSNLCILFYTKNSAIELKLLYKLIIIIIIQNGVLIICNIIRFKSLPFWFRYRKIIKLKYLKKFGVIHNKTSKNKAKGIINNDNISEKPKLKFG